MTQIPDWFDHVGPGWRPILEQLHHDIVALDPWYTVDQVKEKFGALRAYLVFDDELPHYGQRIGDLIKEAMAKSAVTCEECGAAGFIRQRPSRNWMVCLCDDCVLKPPPNPW